MNVNPLKFSLSALALSAALTSTALAELLVYEGFDGYKVATMNGQVVSEKAVGLDASSFNSSIYSATNPFIWFSSTGLTFSDLSVSGGCIYNKSILTTGIGVGLDATHTGTLYSSYLVRFDASPTSDTLAKVSLGFEAFENSHHSVYADGRGGTAASINYSPENRYETASTTTLRRGVTYLVLAEFTNVGATLTAKRPGVATLWVLTEGQYDHFKSTGFNTARLSGADIGTSASNVSARIAQTQESGAYPFNNGRFLQVGLSSNSATKAYAIDELRYGTSLDDVTPVRKP